MARSVMRSADSRDSSGSVCSTEKYISPAIRTRKATLRNSCMQINAEATSQSMQRILKLKSRCKPEKTTAKSKLALE